MNNREEIRHLLKLPDELLIKLGRPGMTGPGRIIATKYTQGETIEEPMISGNWKAVKEPHFYNPYSQYRVAPTEENIPYILLNGKIHLVKVLT